MRSPLWFSFVAVTACQSAPSSGQAFKASERLPAPASSNAAAIEELERLDERRAVPLLPMMANHQKQNMREHLVVVQELVVATAQGDFAEVARAARRMGYSEAMGRMCEHMGAGAPGFTQQALDFHHSADRIADAAVRKDSVAVLTALGATLSTCTACHAAYKQKLVDELPDERQ